MFKADSCWCCGGRIEDDDVGPAQCDCKLEVRSYVTACFTHNRMLPHDEHPNEGVK